MLGLARYQFQSVISENTGDVG